MATFSDWPSIRRINASVAFGVHLAMVQKNIQEYPKVYDICKKQREQLGPITEKLYSTKIAFGQSQSEMRKKELDAEFKKLEKQRDYVIYTYETNDCKKFFKDRL